MPAGRYLKLSTFLFVAAYAIVHAKFEMTFWTVESSAAAQGSVFTKYDSENPNRELVASRVYFTKALWMFSLVLLQTLSEASSKFGGFDFFSAMALSTTLYAATLLYFFPLSPYIGANCLGAFAMLVTWLFNL
jgi:hypothetical protein